MRPIERAARAAVEECSRQDQEPRDGPYVYQDDDLTRIGIDGKVDMLALVRAVLLSFREPSDAMLNAGADAPFSRIDHQDAEHLWQAMIDTALSE